VGSVEYPVKAMRVVAAFSRHDAALDWAREWGISRWGPIALESPNTPRRPSTMTRGHSISIRATSPRASFSSRRQKITPIGSIWIEGFTPRLLCAISKSDGSHGTGPTRITVVKTFLGTLRNVAKAIASCDWSSPRSWLECWLDWKSRNREQPRIARSARKERVGC